MYSWRLRQPVTPHASRTSLRDLPEILLCIPGSPKTSLVSYRTKDDAGHSRRFPSFTDDSTPFVIFVSAFQGNISISQPVRQMTSSHPLEVEFKRRCSRQEHYQTGSPGTQLRWILRRLFQKPSYFVMNSHLLRVNVGEDVDRHRATHVSGRVS